MVGFIGCVVRLKFHLLGFLASNLEVVFSTERTYLRVMLPAMLLKRLDLYKLGEHLIMI